MSQLTNSIKRTTQQAAAQVDALDRVLTENEATLSTAALQSRKLDIKVADLQAQIAAALAL